MRKKSLIYTRTGDKSTTSLVGGVRVLKNHIRLEAYGTVDELNAYLGLLIVAVEDIDIKSFLREIQHRLFSLGAYLATDQRQTNLKLDNYITPESISRLEENIDELDASLPCLRGFILPGGAYAASVCHICRTICRRAERCIINLEIQESVEIDDRIKQFINRLSDYLFVLARKLNQLTQNDEIYWDKRCK